MYSIVVPTFNRACSLGVTLESLLTQNTGLPYEILVVDNNSADETRSVVQALEKSTHGKLRYAFQRGQGLSRARNAGIAAAQGEILAFVDDDVIAMPDWLAALAETYEQHPNAWCVGGKIVLKLPETNRPWFDRASRSLAWYLSGLDLGERTIKLDYPSSVWGANFSVRRDALVCVGPFNPSLGRDGACLLSGEDVELCLRIHRAGGTIYYCGQAAVIHRIPPSRMTKRFFRRRAYWQGRTAALVSQEDFRRPLWDKASAMGFAVVRDSVRTLYHYCIGDIRGGFERELAARLQVGSLQQALLMRARRDASTNWDLSQGGSLVGATPKDDIA